MAAHATAVAVFANCGVYQLSRPKDRCRALGSPIALLMHYGSYRGRLRDLCAEHGGYCLGCSWSAALVAAGMMNVAAMAGRPAGVAALGLAVAIIWLPWLASGLRAASQMAG